ncbi:gonadotropin-releasing hormone II receptor [Biomphalaria glabrata]|nr:gonadotropin-releasing hormone II receptor [Biomphalaria glabrata]
MSRQQTKHEVMTSFPGRSLRLSEGSSTHTPKHHILSQSSVSLHLRMRCTATNNLSRAKLRTLKMTSCIVGIFIICWTPYFSVILYHWITKDSSKELDSKVQRLLFIFAVSNSCLDPLIYGMFTKTLRNKYSSWKDYVYLKLYRTRTSSTF